MNDIKEFLDLKYEEYNNASFIINDPISIPHLFTQKEDIEIIGFLIATIAWGKRNSIIKNGYKLLDIMGHEPYNFVMNAEKSDLEDLIFVHRTFNAIDLSFFIQSLKSIYTNLPGGLESAFSHGDGMANRIASFRKIFLGISHNKRSDKHLSNPLKGSASKRINMFLRWMVRKDNKGVDFGIWNTIKPSELYIPLDVHTGNVSRKLGLITRKANDWKALEELMANMRKFDSTDPCKYDYALFGLGISGF